MLPAPSRRHPAGMLLRDLIQPANAVVDQAGGGCLSQPQEAADGENPVRIQATDGQRVRVYRHWYGQGHLLPQVEASRDAVRIAERSSESRTPKGASSRGHERRREADLRGPSDFMRQKGVDMFKKAATASKERSGTDAPVPNRNASEPRISAASNVEVTREAIAQLAFQKWQKRGCPTGQGQRDWFEAERELKLLQATSTRRG